MSAVEPPRDAGPAADTGLLCLLLLARYHEVAADEGRVRREFGPPGQAFDEGDIIRAARAIGLKARAVGRRWSQLGKTPLPAILCRRDGGYAVLARVHGGAAHVHDPGAPRPRALSPVELDELWTGRLVLIARRTGPLEARRRFGLGWFVPAVVKYRWVLGEVLVASAFVQLFALLTPLCTQVVIDRVLVHKGLTTLHVLAIGMMAAAVFEVVLSGLRTHLLAHTSSRIDVELGAAVYRHALALPLTYYQARRVGDTVARVRELDRIRELLTGSALTVAIDGAFTAVFLSVLALYSLPLTALVLAALPGFALLSLAVTPVLRRRLDEKFDRGAESQAFLVESITGIETVKALALEPAMRRRWEEQLAGYVRAGFRAVALASAAGQGAALLQKATTIAILWVGAHAVMRAELTVGELVAFNMLAGRVTGPVLRIVQLWQDFQQAGVSVARLGDLLDAPREPVPPAGRSAPGRLAGHVVFENVTFRYRLDRGEALREVSFRVEPGEIVGVVGRSGSGKSTLARLVQRLFVPEAGRVLVDGLDVAHVDPAWLRRQVGVVLQDSFLFNRSVRENIAIADPGLPFERILQAATLAGADEFVRALPDGYDTLVGEHGCALSGGQRQRIAIARALAAGPRILILDEATSALDAEAERVFQGNLGRICAGRTVFIIAHRLSTLRPAHRILVLDRGRLVEEGSHADLLERNGIYAALSRLQSPPRAAAPEPRRPVRPATGDAGT